MADSLVIGCPSPFWLKQLQSKYRSVYVVEPGNLFAKQLGIAAQQESTAELDENGFDVAIAVSTLDTVNDLPSVLHRIKRALRPGSPIVGAMSGGNSLPALRSALIEGERASGTIAQRVHPRIDAPTLVELLNRVGFEQSVVDIDRVTLRYPSLLSLVSDLRAMGASNQLAAIAPLSRTAATLAAATFEATATDGKIAETIEILHFAGWSPQSAPTAR